MTDKDEKHRSQDHWLEQEGTWWKESGHKEDFSPYIPESKFNLRTVRAKELLAKHGIDAIVLFADGNSGW